MEGAEYRSKSTYSSNVSSFVSGESLRVQVNVSFAKVVGYSLESEVKV